MIDEKDIQEQAKSLAGILLSYDWAKNITFKQLSDLLEPYFYGLAAAYREKCEEYNRLLEVAWNLYRAAGMYGEKIAKDAIKQFEELKAGRKDHESTHT